MDTIKLITPLKRFRGLSKSKKALVFLSKGYGGQFYSIPKWAVISQRNFEEVVNENYNEKMIEVVFDSKAIKGQHPLNVLLNDIIESLQYSSETQIIK